MRGNDERRKPIPTEVRRVPASFHGGKRRKKPPGPWLVEVRYKKWKKNSAGFYGKSSEWDEWMISSRHHSEDERERVFKKQVRGWKAIGNYFGRGIGVQYRRGYEDSTS